MLAGSIPRPSRAEPFYVPDTISEDARAVLRGLENPAARPPYPAPDDLPARRRLFEEREASLRPPKKK